MDGCTDRQTASVAHINRPGQGKINEDTNIEMRFTRLRAGQEQTLNQITVRNSITDHLLHTTAASMQWAADNEQLNQIRRVARPILQTENTHACIEHKCAHTHTQTRAHAHTHVYTHTCARARTHTCTCTHAHMHAHSHSRTTKLTQSFIQQHIFVTIDTATETQGNSHILVTQRGSVSRELRFHPPHSQEP